MSVTSGFFDSMNKDRLYNTRQLSSIFDGIIKDGVYMGYEDALMVKASEPASLTVNVGPGRSWFNHTWTYNDAPLPIELDPGDVVLDRIDTIVIDVDTRSSVRKNDIILVKGTPSSQATAPVLINEEGHYQYPLCDISVPANATTITQAQITNRIGTSDCPFVTGIIETISTDELLAQWNAEYREWYARVQAETEQWTEQQQTEFTEWMNARKEEFDAWFSGLQTILDGDVAGNLLNRINHRTGINATATYSAGVVAITAPDDAGEILTFVAPSDFLSSDTYTLNGEALTITDLNGEALDDSWKKNSPVTITVSGGKAFFKAGGSGKNDTLPPLLGNMTVEVVEGDENDTYTIKMDKLILDKTTEMVGGAQLEWGEEMPEKPGKGTGGIKTWTRDEIVTTGKPYDGLYLGDVTPSDAVSEVLLWLPENKDGKVVLIPFIILSVDYLGGVYVVRKFVWDAPAFGVESVDSYDGSTLDTFMQSYANSVISDEILNEIVEVDYSIFSVSLSGNKTVKRKVITVSAGECNMEGFTDGNKIPRFSTPANRIAYDESGQARAYWTRTKQNASSSIGVNTSGNFIGYTPTSSQYTRPSFVLPKDFKVQKRPDGSYTAWTGESGLTWSDLMVSDEVTETIVNILEPKTGMVPTIYLSDDFNESDALLLLRRDVLNVTATGNRYKMGGAGDQYSKSNTYAKIQSWAENDVDPKIIAKKVLTTIKQRSIYYDGGQDKNVYAITSCEAYAFELGNDELGFSAFSEGVCGTKLPYFSSDTRRIAKLDANIKSYNTRDAAVRTLYDDSWYIVTAGGTRGSTTSAVNVRPSILISKDVWFNKLADGSYDLIPEDPAPGTQTVSTLAETGTPVQLKDIPVSTAGSAVTLKIPETADTYEEYLYGFKNYEGSNAGALVRKDIFDKENYSSTSSLFVNYGGSTLDTSLVDFANNNLDESVKKYLVEVQVQARGGPYPRSCFALSDDELGAPKVSPVYGTAFPYFSSNEARIAQYAGAASSYWGRDTSGVGTGSTGVMINESGVPTVIYAANALNGIRPTIAISLDSWFVKNDDGTYTFVGDKPVDDTPTITYTVKIPHGQKVVFRQFTQNQKKQFQTMLVGAVYPPLGDVEEPFVLPEFTGNHAIFGDEIEGRIELYEAGDLTLGPGTYDFFLVGGGSGGGNYHSSNNSNTRGGGGGAGGYTKTYKSVKISKTESIQVVIGAGGNAGDRGVHRGSGSESSMTFASGVSYSAPGATAPYQASIESSGGTGGSGGGSAGGIATNNIGGTGGSDGGNGTSGTGNHAQGSPGAGQGTTTRMFEEESGTLYAGGGGGYGYSGSTGGAGGGGAGGSRYDTSSYYAKPGTPNTGGGGGGGMNNYYRADKDHDYCAAAPGGSGIIIIRWNNAAS